MIDNVNDLETVELADNDKRNISAVAAEAKILLQKAARMPTKWGDIFNAIEMFRKKVQAGRDAYDSTANDAQVGLMSPMLIMFALMLETNMLMEPLDTNIIINVLSDNFRSEKHIETLKDLLNELHPNKKEFVNEYRKKIN